MNIKIIILKISREKKEFCQKKKKAKTASEDRGKKIKYKDREEAGAREAAARGEIATKEN